MNNWPSRWAGVIAAYTPATHASPAPPALPGAPVADGVPVALGGTEPVGYAVPPGPPVGTGAALAATVAAWVAVADPASPLGVLVHAAVARIARADPTAYRRTRRGMTGETTRRARRG